MMITKYKVVKIAGTEFVSSNADLELLVRYTPGKWSTAPIGGLLVFKTLRHARKFRDGDANEYIFSCAVEEPVRLPAARESVPKFLLPALRAWRVPRKRWQRVWPAGTEAYRLVKLIEEVKCRQ